MRNKVFALTLTAFLLTCACGAPSSNVANTATSKPASTTAASTPAAQTPTKPKDGDYDAKGVVTKLNPELGSVELNHEDIPGLMPPMQMEFFVTDKKLLEGLKVGDKVDFVIRYKDPTETIVKIGKAK